MAKVEPIEMHSVYLSGGSREELAAKLEETADGLRQATGKRSRLEQIRQLSEMLETACDERDDLNELLSAAAAAADVLRAELRGYVLHNGALAARVTELESRLPFAFWSKDGALVVFFAHNEREGAT